MTKPSVVVFDLGKVLLDFDYGIVARKISTRAKASADDVRKLLDHSPLLYRYETGLTTKEEFFKMVCDATGFCGGFDDFRHDFSDIFWEIWPMIQWQATLRAKKIPTFIFSNTNELAIAHIRKTFPFFQNFDGYIFSYEIGAMKPDAKIYEALEKMAGRRGAEILYLDDRAENIAAGAARGWQTILHRTSEETRLKISELGLWLKE